MVSTGGSNGHSEAGVSRITGELAKVISQVPPVVESLTGIKLDDLFARLKTAPPDPPEVSGTDTRTGTDGRGRARTEDGKM
jgi:hypothetical protein